MSNIKKFEEFIVENSQDNNEVLSFLNKQMNKDKTEYKGHIPTKYNKGVQWDDSGWMVDEINNFLNKNYNTSYTLIKFGKTYDYGVLKNILNDNFPIEFNKVVNQVP